MSKIGEKPVLIKPENKLSQESDILTVSGPLGEVKIKIPNGISLNISEKEVLVLRANDEKKVKSCHGTIARLIENAVKGTTEGFTKVLEVFGTGYRVQMEGTTLVLNVGFSHQVRFPTPEGIKIETLENIKIKVFGVNKEIVGTIADKIKKIKVPDSYKGKGIRYQGEILKLKPGKAAAKAGAATGGK